MTASDRPLELYAFAPAWGLPSSGPFALKLMAWLGHVGIPYRHVIENRPEKGPLGKSPWVILDGRAMGDSDAIMAELARRHGHEDPFAIRTAADARADAMATAFEERFHQILEWELFVHPAGADGFRDLVAAALPRLLAGAVAARMRRHFRRQLHARGIGRLPPARIAETGRRQLDGLALVLSEGSGWIGRAGPGRADFAVWGQVAPLLAWPMRTPVADHAKGLPELQDWHRRILSHCLDAPTGQDHAA